MNFFNTLLVIETFFLILLFVRLYILRKTVERSLIAITVLCALQLVAFVPAQFNLDGKDPSSILFRMADWGFCLECIFIDYILILCAQYLLKITRLRTRLTYLAFVFFWVFAAADTVVFLFNGITSFVYSTSTAGPPDGGAGLPVLFYHISNGWMLSHQFFSVALVILIFVSMLLKCTSVPFVYAGKYILIGVFFLAISVVNFLGERLSAFILFCSMNSFLIGAIPFLLYYQANFYRPRFLLGSIRQMVFEKLGTPVVLFDDENILIDYNSTAAELFRLNKSVVNHLSLREFLSGSVGNQLRVRTTSTVEEVAVDSPSGTKMIFKLDYIKLNNKNGRDYGTLLFFHDITELKKLYNSMELTAMTDPLTSLSNKVYLQKKLTEINLYRKFPYTAVVCSLNGINLISECFGEDTGRAAIKHVADLLKSQLRASDFAAYDDGNMVILMPDTTEADANQVFLRISRILNHDRTFNFTLSFEYGISPRPSPDSPMEQTMRQAYVAMVNKKMRRDDEVQESIIDSLRDALRFSSFETEQHSIRVRKIASMIAEEFNLDEYEMNNIRNLALFHDIGKMSVPAELINKPSSLTEDEKRIMQLHVINGYKIANVSKELRPIAKSILCHHERWDGTGYPNGYSGDNIPFLSRIISIADSYDVMTHDRPYQKARPEAEAVEEIIRNSGTQFDPSVVEVFLNLDFVKEIRGK